MTPTNQTKATPRPWVMRKVKTSIGHCYKIASPELVEKDHGCICVYDDDTGLNPLQHGEAEANAALIVQAVNSHSTLCEVASMFENALDALSKTVRKQWPLYPENQMMIAEGVSIEHGRQLLRKLAKENPKA